MTWSKCKGEGVSIAILDSGIDISRSEFKQIKFTFLNNCEDRIGHGTAVASIIAKIAPKASLYFYNMFEKEENIIAETLIDVLKIIKQIKHFDIIHLSCGISVCDDISGLYEICKKITDEGTVIISAFDNEGVISFPAAFNNVIGVDWNPYCADGMKYYAVEDSSINLMGLGSLQRLPWSQGEYKYVAGSSFAAPYITGIAAQMLEYGITPENLLKELIANAQKIIHIDNSLFNPQNSIFKIQKAIVIPFNKEIQTLISFEKMLMFEVVGIYDFPIFRNIGKNCTDVMNFGDSQKIIECVKDIKWDDDFDTVIIGHLGVISAALKSDLLSEILDSCIKYRKNVYAFDDLRKYKMKTDILNENGQKYYYPKADISDIDKSLMGKLYNIATPVVGIFGTSSKQGKFSLQLLMRQKLNKLGYKVGGLGTEPTSPLFGIDKVYPMGYGGIRLSGADAVQTINRYMHEIDIKKYDIIIVGSQSQTIPYNTGNIGHYPIAQHEFFIGTNPDAVVLCINPYDEPQYVKRTICYLQNYLYTKVLAIVIFPKYRELEWTMQGTNMISLNKTVLNERKEFYNNAIGLPCYVAGDDMEMDLMLSCIIDYFADS